MEAAIPLNLPQVHSLSDRLTIERLQVRDEAAIRLAYESEDPVATVTQMIAIGARVLDRETAGAQAEAMRLELEKASAEARHTLGSTTERVTGEMVAKLVELFGSGESPGAVPQRIDQIVGRSMMSAREELVRHLTSDQSPLVQMGRATAEVDRERHEQHQREFKTLRDELAAVKLQLERARAAEQMEAAVAAEAERGTAKGRTYEEAVFDAVQAIARGRGDDCDAIGDTVGDGGRKGDVLVSVEGASGPARGRIVFEAKDRQLSKNAALEELDRALEQRTADYAVLVVPSADELPARCHALHEFNGDKVFAVYDPQDGSALALEVAYGLARARTLMDAASVDGIDEAAVRVEVEQALQATEAVRRIKSQLTTATKGIENAQGLVDAMAVEVRARLSQIETLLAGAEADQPEDQRSTASAGSST